MPGSTKFSFTKIQHLKGHDEIVSAVAFSPDGQLLASASWDKHIRIWRVNNWQLYHALEGHSGSIYAIAFSPKDNILASGANDKSIMIWNFETGALVRTIEAHDYLGIDELSFSPDGSMLASASSDGTATIWKATDWTAALTVNGYQPRGRGFAARGKCSVAFSPDGRFFASTEPGENFVKLWRASNGKLVQQFGGHKAPIEAIAFSPDGQLVACALWDSTLLVYEVSDATLSARLGKPRFEPTEFKGGRVYHNQLCSVAFSHNGSILVAGGDDKSVQLRTVPKWKLVDVSEDLAAPIKALAFSPRDEYLAVALGNGNIVVLAIS